MIQNNPLHLEFIEKIIQQTASHQIHWVTVPTFTKTKNLSRLSKLELVFLENEWHTIDRTSCFIAQTKDFNLAVTAETFISGFDEKETKEKNLYLYNEQLDYPAQLNLTNETVQQLEQIIVENLKEPDENPILSAIIMQYLITP